MRKRLEDRLVALKAELDKGNLQLRQMEVQCHRISGAIILLEELLKQELEDKTNGYDTAPGTSLGPQPNSPGREPN